MRAFVFSTVIPVSYTHLLKSTLCQYIALTQMFQDKNIEGVELGLSDPHDYSILAEFLITE